MKYINYFIFLAFIAVLLFFLKNALEPEEEPVLLTGSQKCGECHRLQNISNQQEVWEKSKHFSAFKMLYSLTATDFAAKNNLDEPSKNKLCLRCHTTEFYLRNPGKAPSYEISEGVGCESCHGAGSKYSPAFIMKDNSLFVKNGGIRGDESTCKSCHSPKGNKEQKISENVCPFQAEDFVYSIEFEKIKHPIKRDFK